MANETQIRESVNSIYNSLLSLRKRKVEEDKAPVPETEDENKILTKKEKAQLALDNWKSVIIGLTGDDLEYVEEKKSKKKYKAWLGEDEEIARILSEKPKKPKKRNFNKEFESELNMLKSIVADQNRFTSDLQKRYQHTVGPVGKDSIPLNKTTVELAAVINASRNNSLSMLREIGNIKKTIADLYMKQRKLDNELNGGGFDTNDIGLMGSSVASSLFNQPINNPTNTPTEPNTPLSDNIPMAIPVEEYDPSRWEATGVESGSTRYETIPHKIVVEWYKSDNRARFKAIKLADGTELTGAPVPSCNIKTFDVKSMQAKDEFDQVYPLEIVEEG